LGQHDVNTWKGLPELTYVVDVNNTAVATLENDSWTHPTQRTQENYFRTVFLEVT